MTTVYSRRCDYCGREQEDCQDQNSPLYFDPDRWDGWWTLAIEDMSVRTHYDFCSKVCLLCWAEDEVQELPDPDAEVVDDKNTRASEESAN